MHRRPLVAERLEPRRLLAFNPTPFEQEMLQLVNRSRSDPAGEFDRLIESVDPPIAYDADVTQNLQFFETDLAEFRRQTAGLTAVPPVAWHATLHEVAAEHSRQMIQFDQQSHQLPGEASLGGRILDAGYDYRGVGENVFAYCTTAEMCHAGLFIDWGEGPHGIQDPPGHRVNILNASWQEVGIGVIAESDGATAVGPNVATQDFARRSDAPVQAVGAVFADADGSTWYEAGEGVGGATVEFSGPAGRFSTTSMSAGGYQLDLPPGTYTAVASGGSLDSPLTVTGIEVGNRNVWVNFVATAGQLAADRFEPNDSFATATELAPVDQVLENLTLHRSFDDDYFAFTPTDDGQLAVDAFFRHADGDIDLFLFDTPDLDSEPLAQSVSETDDESLHATVEAGATYYLAVVGFEGAVHPEYALEVRAPEPAEPLPPTARSDRQRVELGATASIDVLVNDEADAGQTIDVGSVQLESPGEHNGAVWSVDPATGHVTVEAVGAAPGFTSNRYRIDDTDGRWSDWTPIQVMIYAAGPQPWRNAADPADVDANGQVHPLDALLVINQLNRRGGPTTLPDADAADAPWSFVDVDGNNRLEPLDALLVINRLNRADRAQGSSAWLPADDERRGGAE